MMERAFVAVLTNVFSLNAYIHSGYHELIRVSHPTTQKGQTLARGVQPVTPKVASEPSSADFITCVSSLVSNQFMIQPLCF